MRSVNFCGSKRDLLLLQPRVGLLENCLDLFDSRQEQGLSGIALHLPHLHVAQRVIVDHGPSSFCRRYLHKVVVFFLDLKMKFAHRAVHAVDEAEGRDDRRSDVDRV